MKEIIKNLIIWIGMMFIVCILPLYALFISMYLTNNGLVDIGCFIAVVYIIDKSYEIYKKYRYKFYDSLEKLKD